VKFKVVEESVSRIMWVRTKQAAVPVAVIVYRGDLLSAILYGENTAGAVIQRASE